MSIALITTLAVGITSCGGGSTPTAQVKVDGSSTVFPISEAMAEEFQKANPEIQVTVGVSGTGGGFKKFCAGETDISNGSRPIKESEIELCKKGGIEYIELPIAFDGLSVVVNKENNFASCLKTAELKKIWEPAAQDKVKNWKQINPKFPNLKLGLYGPGTDSGTYDYFMENIVGKKVGSRGDYTASEDDNLIVQGVSTDKGGLGFFGYAYYEENKDKLKLVKIDGGSGCVAPSTATIADGTYKPLSRPEFIYVKKEAATRPEVKAFVDYQLAAANSKLISEVGYVPMPEDIMMLVRKRFSEGTVGSVFANAPKGSKVKQLLEK
ncbi:PstS family phosphate ABC transporter substrate-binding protein [Moorena producens JHB]|uniref:Phosphate-binding protein n=1 Tax=Moorena producens (strain JHB) TaxID=1454205 RepID=A0A1D9G0J8_MOOP1|nr:PstS family phosphate ABC transporter substrate-binding protein [Moorena producens]AOY81101.2 PstS family phosphate ABC transporter substrate-binding protein [Moorena producens JHB]